MDTIRKIFEPLEAREAEELFRIDQDTIFPVSDNILWKGEPNETGAFILNKKIDKPKPCPFCGGKNIVFIDSEGMSVDDDDSAEQYAVCCSFLKGGCGATSGFKQTRFEAMIAWNRRVDNE